MSKIYDISEGMFCHTQLNVSVKWSSWDFLSPLILQKMKEDNISQLGDYDVPFCEQYRHGSCYISLFKFKSFDQLIPPPPPPNLLQILDIYRARKPRECRHVYFYGPIFVWEPV